MALVGAQFVNAVSPNPVGSLQAYAGASAPTGWLLCDGTSYSTSVYPELFSVLGYTYGGSAGNFNVPDLRGRTPIGSGNDGTASNDQTRTLGAKGGDWRLQSHTHSTTVGNDSPDHAHGTGTAQQFATHIAGTVNAAPGSSMPVPNGVITTTAGATARHSHSVTVNAHSRSQGGAENMPPFLVTNYIIKAVPDAPRSGLAYGSTPPIVTALPSNPQFGDVVTYIADATNGVAWNLQYDATGTYPWKFVGGAPLYNLGGGGSVTQPSYSDAGGASLVVPLAGDYLLDYRCHFQLASGETGYLSVYLGTTAADGDAAYAYASSANMDAELARVFKKTLSSANTTVKTQARLNTGGPRTWSNFQLSITPIRVKAA